MQQVTEGRIRNFCRTVLEQGGEARTIGFVDVGSGGELKEPWALLPADRVSTFDFEPTRGGGSGLPLCVSDGSGTAPFFVAHDERASSFHKPLQEFVDRYALDGMLTKKTITVERASLDEYFSGRYEQVDAIDINVEGHDLQVLQGATRLLAAGAVKLLKVEFELIPVYEGQGYFGDIDAFMRARDFRLAWIEIENGRPSGVTSLFSLGEPLWGKALYAPTIENCAGRLQRLQAAGDAVGARKEAAVAIALYAAARLPGYVCDVIAISEMAALIDPQEATRLRLRLADALRWAKIEEGMRRVKRLWASATGSLR